jgi:ribosomal-protein-alanine N-acetyltransferase
VEAETRLHTARLELLPLPAAAARALPADRETSARLLDAKLPAEWPHDDLLDVLPLQGASTPETAPYGIWVLMERRSRTVVGDAGFLGPPGEDEAVEIGYSVIPDRRGRGYATEAVRALVAWALAQPGVSAVVARCTPDNTPSVRLLDRAGFRRTGVEAEHVRWRIEVVAPDAGHSEHSRRS